MDETEIELLAAELPALARAGRLTQSFPAMPWFANLGEALTPGARASARRYADGLGFPDADVAVVGAWEDAVAAAESADWNSPGWEAEELLRADVTHSAMEVLSEDALGYVLTAAADAVSAATREPLAEVASLFDVEDEAVRNLAVGAAVQAAHQALLAVIAHHDDEAALAEHPFPAKFQLFEFGRWPIGVAGRTLNLF